MPDLNLKWIENRLNLFARGLKTAEPSLVYHKIRWLTVNQELRTLLISIK